MMTRILKTCLFLYALLALISLFLFSDTETEKIQAQLSKAQGKEKITLLTGLTKTYNIKNPQKALEYGKEALELLEKFPDKKL
ncbi:MAG: hypothetical protein JSV88_11365, partial [Candidatus Aminicenantes bacterium]